MRTVLLKWVRICLLGWLCGCTAGPELQKYPEALIDRPYTLPQGVDQWITRIPFIFERNEVDSYSLPPVIPIPLYWNSSLSDDLTLHWLPLPLQISYNLGGNEVHRFGVRTGLGRLGYASGGVIGLTGQWVAGLDHWFRLSPSVSWRSNLRGYYQFFTGSRTDLSGLAVTSGFLFQLSSSFAIHPSVTLITESQFNSFDVVGSSGGSATYVPMGMTLWLALSKQINLELIYNFVSQHNRRGYNSHDGSLDFIVNW